MKLLYITNGMNGAGGLERVLSVKASSLAENYNYEVHIIVLNEPIHRPFYEFSGKIQFHSIPVNGSTFTKLKSYRSGIQETVNRIQPDVISVCDDGLKGFFIPSFLKTTAKIIYERHASIRLNTSKGTLGKISASIMKRQSPKFDRFVVLTAANIQEWSGTNIMAIPNPLSFDPAPSSSLTNKNSVASYLVIGIYSKLKNTLLKLHLFSK